MSIVLFNRNEEGGYRGMEDNVVFIAVQRLSRAAATCQKSFTPILENRSTPDRAQL